VEYSDKISKQSAHMPQFGTTSVSSLGLTTTIQLSTTMLTIIVAAVFLAVTQAASIQPSLEQQQQAQDLHNILSLGPMQSDASAGNQRKEPVKAGITVCTISATSMQAMEDTIDAATVTASNNAVTNLTLLTQQIMALQITHNMANNNGYWESIRRRSTFCASPTSFCTSSRTVVALNATEQAVKTMDIYIETEPLDATLLSPTVAQLALTECDGMRTHAISSATEMELALRRLIYLNGQNPISQFHAINATYQSGMGFFFNGDGSAVAGWQWTTTNGLEGNMQLGAQTPPNATQVACLGTTIYNTVSNPLPGTASRQFQPSLCERNSLFAPLCGGVPDGSVLH